MKVAIVGAGISGCSIARVLSMYENLNIHVVEKEPDACWGTSKANTGIIHAGYDDDPETYPVRAKLCSIGNRLWHQWFKELSIPYNPCGSMVVAFDDEQVKILEDLMKRGEKNRVLGLRIIDRDEASKLEPNLKEGVMVALWAPTESIIEPYEAVIAVAENAVRNGVKFHFEEEVRGIRVSRDSVVGVETNKGFMEADIVINAAGLYADDISKIAECPEEFRITPRKGEYYLFDKKAGPKVQRILFPTPLPWTKGIVVETTPSGNLMLGPTSVELPYEAKEDKSTTREGLDEVWRGALKLVKKLPPKNMVIRTFAGLRAETSHRDFIIKAYPSEVWGFINVAGIRSPGAAAAPAFSYRVVKLIQEELGVKLIKKAKWNPHRRRIRRLSESSDREKARLIEKNPAFGRVLCPCEMVSEAEIREAIYRILRIGAIPTLDGVKFRTRALAGWCQGQFCRLRIAKIMAEKTSVPLHQVTIRGRGTELGIGDIKSLLRQGRESKKFGCRQT